MGGLPESDKRNDSILAVIDRATKLTHLFATRKDSTAEELVETLINGVFKLHGLPKTIHTDRDRRVISDVWKRLCERLHIHHCPTTSLRPSSNGQVERQNQSIGQLLRISRGCSTDDRNCIEQRTYHVNVIYALLFDVRLFTHIYCRRT